MDVLAAMLAGNNQEALDVGVQRALADFYEANGEQLAFVRAALAEALTTDELLVKRAVWLVLTATTPAMADRAAESTASPERARAYLRDVAREVDKLVFGAYAECARPVADFAARAMILYNTAF